MSLCRPLAAFPFITVALLAHSVHAVSFAQDSSSNSSRTHASQTTRPSESSLDAGSVSAGVYRNSAFGFTCKIPAGWVLRTEEMNVSDATAESEQNRATPGRTAEGGCPHTGTCGRVLLAAFSRPPEAKAEDVNGSILIAAESAAAYPGLTDAAQYFGPVIAAAKAQGLEIDDDPYEFAVGTKKVVRGDFQKDVGTRVMLQSTLVTLGRGYVVSFTFIGGTEDEVEELVEGLNFRAGAKTAK